MIISIIRLFSSFDMNGCGLNVSTNKIFHDFLCDLDALRIRSRYTFGPRLLPQDGLRVLCVFAPTLALKLASHAICFDIPQWFSTVFV